MPLYDFTCPDGHVTEKRASYDTEAIPCACGQPAPRQFSPPGIKVHKGPANWDIKTADGKWRLSHFKEAHAENAYFYEQREKAGDPVQRPDLFKEAYARARQRDRSLRPL